LTRSRRRGTDGLPVVHVQNNPPTKVEGGDRKSR